jgi:hypothetical protein
VGGFSCAFNVSAVDTFIEKPFSVLALRGLATWQSRGGDTGKQRAAAWVGTLEPHARAHFRALFRARLGWKRRLGLLFSFSVGGLA